MKNKRALKAVTLFASAGIAETYFSKAGIEVVVSNELLNDRCNLYSYLYPKTKMVCGDITKNSVFNKILESCPKQVDILIASPPCQGVSIAGKNRNNVDMLSDDRNFLIKQVFKFIDRKKPSYILIENVPTFLSFKMPYRRQSLTVVEILKKKFGKEYEVKSKVLDAANFGVAQTRKRAMILMYEKDKKWDWPKESKTEVTVKKIIGHLPSLEAGEKSSIKWHFARKHTLEHIRCMSHTPTSCTALDNADFYPKKKDGSKVKGFRSSYRRISWDKPAPTITMRNDAISSQRNVHPGRKKIDGTYSDARVLTPLELMLLSSLPKNWAIPKDTPEKLIRDCLGECIPPLMIEKVLLQINK